MAARRRRLRSLLLAAGTLLCAAAVVILVQLRPPAWWTPSPTVDDALDRVGERFEQGWASEISRIRPDTAPWAVRVGEDEVNAWLTARLPLWCAHVGVEPIGDVRVHLADEVIEVAAMLPDLPALVVASLRPTVTGGRLDPGLGTTCLGRLPVPFLTEGAMRSAVEQLGSGDDDLRAVLLPALRGESVDATFELVDHRRVRLRDIEVREGELLMEFETLPAESRTAQ